MLIMIHKCVHINFYPVYKDLLTLPTMVFSLRGTDNYCLCVDLLLLLMVLIHSFKYFACKTWNSLPENIRTESTLAGFKRLIRTISFQPIVSTWYYRIFFV